MDVPESKRIQQHLATVETLAWLIFGTIVVALLVYATAMAVFVCTRPIERAAAPPLVSAADTFKAEDAAPGAMPVPQSLPSDGTADVTQTEPAQAPPVADTNPSADKQAKIKAVATATEDIAPFRGMSWLSAFGLTLGVGIAALVAASAAGGFFGFLFGIPRVLTGDRLQSKVQPSTSTTATQLSNRAGVGVLSNSNLEEISDWLTKMIVGVVLIQARPILDAVEDGIAFFDRALVHAPAGGPFLMMVALAGAVASFLFFYLETRTRVALLLNAVETDGLFEPRAAQAAYSAPIAQNTGGPTIGRLSVPEMTDIPLGSRGPGSTFDLVTPPAEPLPGDEVILRHAYGELQNAMDFAAWGAAQARAGKHDEALRALEHAVELDPGNLDMRLRLAEAQTLTEDFVAAVVTLKAARTLAPDDWPVARRLLATGLWIDPPDGYEHVLKLAKKFEDDSRAARDPWFYVWKAAAHGQRYADLTDAATAAKPADAATLKESRDEALAAVRKAVELATAKDSAPRRILRGMLEPGSEGMSEEDDDLESFKTDVDFVTLIKGAEAGATLAAEKAAAEAKSAADVKKAGQ